MNTADTPRRTRLLASGLLLISFVAGALVGAAGERLLTAEKPAAQVNNEPARPGERDRSRAPRSILLEPGVFEQIGATAEQRQKIQEILTRRDQGAKRIWSEFAPRMDAMMDSTRGEIRARLTAEQRSKLDQLIEERRARYREQRGHRAPDGKSRPDSAKK
jgi:Spy/CpxP family protein refolding chaperone